MNDYIEVLSNIKSHPETFQSNYSRINAAFIAEAASRGHVTCIGPDGFNKNVWEITLAGMSFLSIMGGRV